MAYIKIKSGKTPEALLVLKVGIREHTQKEKLAGYILVETYEGKFTLKPTFHARNRYHSLNKKQIPLNTLKNDQRAVVSYDEAIQAIYQLLTGEGLITKQDIINEINLGGTPRSDFGIGINLKRTPEDERKQKVRPQGRQPGI